MQLFQRHGFSKHYCVVDVPLLQNDLVLLLPRVFKVCGELVPDGEEGVGRNLFLSALGLHREEHAELQEPATQTELSERNECFPDAGDHTAHLNGAEQHRLHSCKCFCYGVLGVFLLEIQRGEDAGLFLMRKHLETSSQLTTASP